VYIAFTAESIVSDVAENESFDEKPKGTVPFTPLSSEQKLRLSSGRHVPEHAQHGAAAGAAAGAELELVLLPVVVLVASLEPEDVLLASEVEFVVEVFEPVELLVVSLLVFVDSNRAMSWSTANMPVRETTL